MDVHKKERSTRQHLRIDVGRNSPDLLLANPMACGDISPAGMVSPPQPPIARNSERGSFKKSRPKSPSLLRFFVRGGSRKVSSADEEEYGSSSSDHEDPFSPRGTSGVPIPDMVSRQPRDKTASHDPAHHRQWRTGRLTQRDSGFSSERDSVSHRDEKDGPLQSMEVSPEAHPPPEPEYRPGGMEALEMLHNHLQLLVKSDCPEGQLPDLQDQVISSLRRQLADLQQSLDCLHHSDHHLRLSLRLAEQRGLEAETKLAHAMDRHLRLEQRYLHLACKYQKVARKFQEMEKLQQRQAVLQQMERVTHSQSVQSGLHQVQRVQSQREFDRQQSDAHVHLIRRPSSAQGTALQQSLSHTETCV